MARSQIFLSAGAIILVFVLFQLPRVVVENEQVQDVTGSEAHSLAIPQEVRARMAQLILLIQEEEIADKKTNFAHSLASYYLDYGVLDSAVVLGERIEEWSEGASEVAMDIYFKAFERSQSQEEAKAYAEKSRVVIEALLEEDPSSTSLRNKLAMTLVVSEAPMAGIAVLREILEDDADNRQAILNLGLLSIQSGQFERAKERFEKLVSLDAQDYEAKLYLAVSMIEINQQTQARLLLEEILEVEDSIPAIKMMAVDYLDAL